MGIWGGRSGKSLFPVKLNLKCISCGMLYKTYLLALDNKLLENLLSINNFRYSHFIQQSFIRHASMLSMLVIPRQCHHLIHYIVLMVIFLLVQVSCRIPISNQETVFEHIYQDPMYNLFLMCTKFITFKYVFQFYELKLKFFKRNYFNTRLFVVNVISYSYGACILIIGCNLTWTVPQVHGLMSALVHMFCSGEDGVRQTRTQNHLSSSQERLALLR